MIHPTAPARARSKPLASLVVPLLGGLLGLGLAGCPAATPDPVGPEGPTGPPTITLTILTTNDLHGHIETLPMLGGYVKRVREVRAKDGGAVLLVDAGDMFQGTLESNLDEGAAVVAAYNALGYTAAAVGNHEFDFGPVGPSATAGPGEDARGALKARALEAKFPILMANVEDEASKLPEWPNLPPSVVVTAAGVKVGLIGVTTIETPKTTIPMNFMGLKVAPLAPAVVRQAKALREQGAEVIVVLAHAGGTCRSFDEPTDLRSCTLSDELFALADVIPRGTIDVLVGGHTNTGLAHMVNGIAVVEAWKYGRAFGRVDVRFDPRARRVVSAEPRPPHDLCRSPRGVCRPTAYEQSVEEIQPDPAVAAAIQPWQDRTAKLKTELLGVTVDQSLWRENGEESALGNFMTDFMRRARPGVDVAIANGGALRADLPLGPLTYGHLYQAFPFDNHFATGAMRADRLAELIARNLGNTDPLISLSGLRAHARCSGPNLQVTLERENGTPVKNEEMLRVVTSDFLASGGDDTLGRLDFTIEPEAIREAIATAMRGMSGTKLRADQFFDPRARRIVYSGRRPMRCGVR